MSAEVSGEAEGVTLSECIGTGKIPVPPKMNFVNWGVWRKGPGRRPLLRRDGRGIRTEDEVQLWREIMAELYPDGEGEEEFEDEEEEEEEEKEASSPEMVPLEVAAPAAEPPQASRALAALAPAGSAAASSAGTGGHDIPELVRMMHDVFRPDEETMGEFLSRMTRLVMALKSLGHEVAKADVDAIVLRAEIMQEAFNEVGGWHVKQLFTNLRDRFSKLALDVDLTDQEKNDRVGAIGALIACLGGKPSAKSDKLFSTPSDAEGSDRSRSPRKGRPLTQEGLAGLAAQGRDDYLGVRSRLAELEMELAALKRGSDAPSGDKDLAAALEAQTKALTEALKAKPSQTSVTSVKTDVNWPTLTDDRSEARDVVQFYEEFEDCCSLANNRA